MAHVPMYQADPRRPRAGLSARRRLGLLLGSLIVLALLGAVLGGGFIPSSQAMDQALVMADSNLGRPSLVAALRSALNGAPTRSTADLSDLPTSEPSGAVVPVAAEAAQPGDPLSDPPAESEVLADELAPHYPGGAATSLAGWTAPAPSVEQAPTRWLADESNPQSESMLRLAKGIKHSKTGSDIQADGGDGQDGDKHGNDNNGRGEQDRGVKGLVADPVDQGNDNHDGVKGSDERGPLKVPDDHHTRSSNDAGGDNDNKGNKSNDNKGPSPVVAGHGARSAGENGGPENPPDDHGARGGGDNKGPQTLSDDHHARAGSNDQGGKGNDDKGGKGNDDKGGKGKR